MNCRRLTTPCHRALSRFLHGMPRSTVPAVTDLRQTLRRRKAPRQNAPVTLA